MDAADEGIATRKAELRRRFRHIRSLIPADERAHIDVAVVVNAAALPEYGQASILLTYLSFGAEVETRAIIEHAWADGKAVAIPRCVPGTRVMQWHRIKSFEGLEMSALGVEEPADNPATLVEPNDPGVAAIALVPGLAFDAHGFRLGYGGGFYDTFLAGFEGTSIGLCREAQFVDDLADLGVIDGHDLPVDYVANESGTVASASGHMSLRGV